MEAETAMTIGDRILVSIPGPRRGAWKKNRPAVIVGESGDGYCWVVVYDGFKTRMLVNKSFCKEKA